MTPHELIPGPSLKRPPWDGRNGERGEDNAAKIKESADLISAFFNLRGFISDSSSRKFYRVFPTQFRFIGYNQGGISSFAKGQAERNPFGPEGVCAVFSAFGGLESLSTILWGGFILCG